MFNSKVNRFQPVDTFDCKVNKKTNVDVNFNKLSVRTGEPYESNSSLTSSSSEKAGSPYIGLLVRSNKTNTHKTNSSNLNTKTDQSKCDLSLISATTSPYRSEWENKNRPFCTRFYPLIKDNRETEKDRFISVLSPENGLSPNHEKYSPSVNQQNLISSRRIDNLVNIREDEKDRLARIFAFSSPYKKQYINFDAKKNSFSYEKSESQHFLSPLNSLPSNGAVENANERTVDLAKNVGDSVEIKSVSPQSEGHGHCNGCNCSVSQRLEGQLVHKEVQAHFENIKPQLQGEVSNHWSENERNFSPPSKDYLNKEVQTNYDTICGRLLNTFNQNKIVSPKEHSADQKVACVCINGEWNSSPRRFVPITVDNEEKSEQVLPVRVASSPNLSARKMVRIGEFSPLNPRLNSPGHALLGFGEYEERRKALMEQRKHEYCQYLEQARLAAKSNLELKKSMSTNDKSTFSMRDVATQTECSTPKNGMCTSYNSTPTHAPDSEDSSKICGLTSTQMKQFLYREELRKQIEERQRIEAERREKEKLEEEAMEAKIKQQQEEMQRKYEAEMAERLELAAGKKQQEEAMHHRLAEMQKQTLNEKQQNWKHRKDLAGISPGLERTQENTIGISSPQMEAVVVPYPCKTTTNPYQEEREKIFKEINDLEKQYSELRQNTVLHQSPVLPERRFTTPDSAEKNSSNETLKSLNQKTRKRTDKNRTFTVIDFDDPMSRIAHRHEVEEILHRPLIESIPPHQYNSSKSTPVRTSSVGLQNAAEDILRQPLLPPADVENVRNVRDVIPLLSRSNSPPIPAATTRARTNSDALDDKWQIPAVEKYLVTPLDIHSHNNRSVLTQLGAFRKQLQQEQMRMAQDLKSTRVKPS